jgi:hypothetical protein
MTRMSRTIEPDDETLVDRSGVAVLVEHPECAGVRGAGALLAECALGFA